MHNEKKIPKHPRHSLYYHFDLYLSGISPTQIYMSISIGMYIFYKIIIY